MIATKDSWRRQPFVAGVPIPYARAFTRDEFAHIRDGLVPEVMEDKWFIYFDEPNLCLHRSWSGIAAYRVTLDVGSEGARVRKALCADERLDESSPEYEAKLLSFLIGNLLLGEAQPFPMPRDSRSGVAGLLQHLVAGTGYAHQAADDRQRWAFWRR